MKKISQTQARLFLLTYLLDKRYVGAKQTTIENLGRHAREDKRSVEQEALKLAAAGWLFVKKKHYGVHVSINPEKLGEIRDFLSSFQPAQNSPSQD